MLAGDDVAGEDGEDRLSVLAGRVIEQFLFGSGFIPGFVDRGEDRVLRRIGQREVQAAGFQQRDEPGQPGVGLDQFERALLGRQDDRINDVDQPVGGGDVGLEGPSRHRSWPCRPGRRNSAAGRKALTGVMSGTPSRVAPYDFPAL